MTEHTANTGYIEVSPYDFKENLFHLIHKDWALLTAASNEKVNTMTVSWGGSGILWNKPCVFTFVRPQRFTQQLLQESETFSLGFLPQQEKNILNYCGAHSGSTEDKIAACGLSTVFHGQTPYFNQCRIVFLCKKMYKQQFSPECFISDEIAKNYPQQDYHQMYIGEITKILVKE